MTDKPGVAVATRSPEQAGARAAELVAQARTPHERALAFELADELRQAQMIRRGAQLVAATEWGQALSPERRAGFARYCLALGADPLRHVDLLGGNVFINGDYFRDVIAADPDFVRSDDPVWIHVDPRHELCIGCGAAFGADVVHGHDDDAITGENRRRLAERITRARLRLEHNISDESPAACILVLHYRNGRGPFKGLGTVRAGKVKSGPNAGVKDRDPIGLDSPRATAETRAWREAGEKCEATWFRTHAATLEQLAVQLRTAYQAEKAARVQLPAAPAAEDQVDVKEPPPATDVEAVPDNVDLETGEVLEETSPPAPAAAALPDDITSTTPWPHEGRLKGVPVRDWELAMLKWAVVPGRKLGDRTDEWQHVIREELERRARAPKPVA
jgi:hypothetical protein